MRNRLLFTAWLIICSVLAFADNDEGKEYLRKANAHYEAGRYDVAVGYYLKAAEFDEVEAMFDLGYALYHGEGITQDYPSAVMWFKRAANKQYPKAEYNLAFCYMNGQGVPCNYDKALRLLISSAKHGFDQAQLTLSECYEHGVLVEQDLEESKRWKKMAGVAADNSAAADNSIVAVNSIATDNSAAPDKPGGDTVSEGPVTNVDFETDSQLPSFDIQLDGELHERNGNSVATTATKPILVEPSKQQSQKEEEENTEEKRAPIILYPPGMEPPKKAPVLKILYPRDQSFFHTDMVKVKYQLMADGLEDSTKVVVMVDAVKKDLDNHRAVKQANTLDVEVPNRDCTVTLYAHNKVGNSEPVSIRLIRENVAQGDLPRLFCVAVGIGEYHDDKLPSLKLSTKDAHDFADVV